MEKDIHLQVWFFLVFQGANSIETNLCTCNLLSWFISYKSIKHFRSNLPYTHGKKFSICKWVSFAISTFALIEEMAFDFMTVGLISYYL